MRASFVLKLQFAVFPFLCRLCVGRNLSAHDLAVENAAVEALPRHRADLDFRHVQPASALRRRAELDPLSQARSLPGIERLVERCRAMRFQAVHGQHDFYAGKMRVGEIADEARPAEGDSSACNLNASPSFARREGREQAGGSNALLFAVYNRRMPGERRARDAGAENHEGFWIGGVGPACLQSLKSRGKPPVRKGIECLPKRERARPEFEPELITINQRRLS